MRHIVTQYAGIRAGWVPVTGIRPRVKADAEKLAGLLGRVHPQRCYRATALDPELPSFV